MIYEIGSGSGIYCIEGAGARVYYIARPEPMLVDAGAPGRAEAILRDLAQIGVQPIHIKKILLTHHHLGHVGGLGEIKRRSGAMALAHYADAPYIAGKRPRRLPRRARERVFHNAVTRVGLDGAPGVQIDRPLDDSDEVNGWRVIHTPGHTAGHICLLHERVLISGDLVEASAGGFREAPLETITDLETCRASIRRVAALEFSAILPAHNPPYVLNASKKVRELAARLDKD